MKTTTNTIPPQENDAMGLGLNETPGISRQLGDSSSGEDELFRAGK